MTTAEADPGEIPTLAPHQLKALYLYNFTKYVEWPAHAFPSANTPFIIGVLAQPDICRDLQEIIRDKTVNGRPLRVQPLERSQDAQGCQLVFLSGSDRALLLNTLKVAQSTAALTVGDTDDFLALGGIIHFIRRENTLRLEIDLEAAQHASLAVSVKLLAIAESVKGKPSAHK
jgi:hypothetical protein